jgi:hypothetical protein
MAKMQMERQQRPNVKLACLRLLSSLGLNPAQVQLISGFIDTYLRLNQTEQARFQAELDRIEPRKREDVMEIVTSWMEEGLERGRIEGRRQEALALVLRQLTHRVGEVEPLSQERIQELPLTEIEELGVALLDFSSEHDLQIWLDNRPLMSPLDSDRQEIQNTSESPTSDDE